MTVVRPFATTWQNIKLVFEGLRPDLMEEVESFGPQPPSRLADWLDRKFPRPSGEAWGTLPILDVPHLLRDQLELQQ